LFFSFTEKTSRAQFPPLGHESETHSIVKWRHRESVSDRSLRSIKLRSSLLFGAAANYMWSSKVLFFLLKPELEPTQRYRFQIVNLKEQPNCHLMISILI
jgi:hypothetical protein